MERHVLSIHPEKGSAMNCMACGAAMRPVTNRDYLVCEYCSSFHFPAASPDGVKVLGEPSKLRCPVCALSLLSGAAENHAVLECERCQGLLLTAGAFGELARIRHARNGKRPVPVDAIREPSRHLRCPQCNHWLDRHPYYGGPAHLMIDSCERCNLLWLERGVLAAVQDGPAITSKNPV
jgi:Zn-finger nucleic acid-binding protein